LANQSLARRQPAGVVVNQHTPGTMVQRTQRQLQEARGVVVTAAGEYHATRRELEAVVRSGGRSAGHQRYVEERVAYLQYVYDGAVVDVVRQNINTIIKRLVG
jgi:hypothetical protein